MGLLGPKNPKIIYSVRIGHISNHQYRPIWPEIRPGSAGKYYFRILWTQETHFASSIIFITHFATFLKFFEDLENFKISRNGRFWTYFVQKFLSTYFSRYCSRLLQIQNPARGGFPGTLRSPRDAQMVIFHPLEGFPSLFVKNSKNRLF